MNTNELFLQKDSFFEYLKESKRCENTIWMNKYVINTFEQFCLSNAITKIESEVIDLFYSKNLDYNNKTKSYKTVLKRPILAFLDYYNNKEIPNKYFNKKEYIIYNENFKTFFEQYKSNYIENNEISLRSKIRKNRIIINFLNYLDDLNIQNISNIDESIVINYINTMYKEYNVNTKKLYKLILKEFLNYLYKNNLILISGNFIINSTRNNNIIIDSSFTKNEIKKILDSIDITTTNGKHNYLIMCFLVYYGLRAGDIINLKFENIDFEKNIISIIQRKTKNELILPLIDEVKYSLLDYIKNARPTSISSSYILLRLHAPFDKYNNESCISSIISKIIDNAKIDIKDRKKGSRVFRHSIATNMINDNVELHKISSILGHINRETINHYISRDITHLRKLTLEVPYEK